VSAGDATLAIPPAIIAARRTIYGQAGGRGDGLDHEAFERALAQLAEQQAREKFLLAPHGPAEKIGEQTRAFGNRSGAAGASDRIERCVHLDQGQLRTFDIRSGS